MSSLTASAMVGANPRGALQRVSLAVRSAIDDAELSGHDAVVVACSGGADSLALALTAADHCLRRQIPCFSLTVDHGLRAESAGEAQRVAACLAGAGLRARAVHSCVGDSADGPEGGARALRYRLIEAMGAEMRSRGYGRVVVMLGHTADDQAETVLLRLARGSGVASLRAMSPVRSQAQVVVCRPLLGVRRRDTRQACVQLGVVPVEDPTNAVDGPWRTSSGDPLRRSAVRHGALPALSQALGQDPVPALARTAQLAADDDDALEHYAALVYAAAVSQGQGQVPQVSVRAVEPVPVSVRRRVFRRLCVESGARPGELSERHLNSINALIDRWSGQGPVDVPGVSVVRKQGWISFFAHDRAKL